jgi:hypothetical protein
VTNLCTALRDLADDWNETQGAPMLASKTCRDASDEIERLIEENAELKGEVFVLKTALAREDSNYYLGARQAAAMAHQSLKTMDDWIAAGCGGRGPAVKSGESL